jgi:hypothetical protein
MTFAKITFAQIIKLVAEMKCRLFLLFLYESWIMDL